MLDFSLYACENALQLLAGFCGPPMSKTHDSSRQSSRLAQRSNALGTTYSPLYQQIKTLLLQRLDEGEWRPGESIPSEHELAARFQVSQGTVRKAIDELAAENLLIRRQGKGTFVPTHSEPKVRFRFLKLTPDDGHQPVSGSEIIDCQRLRAPAEIAQHLQLKTAATVVRIRRLLSFDGQPTIFDDIWLPGRVFRGVNEDTVRANDSPLYAWFEVEFGVSMVRADEAIRAVAAQAEAVQYLGVPAGRPLLQVDRVSYTYGDRPMEFRRGLYITERFHYRHTLS